MQLRWSSLGSWELIAQGASQCSSGWWKHHINYLIRHHKLTRLRHNSGWEDLECKISVVPTKQRLVMSLRWATEPKRVPRMLDHRRYIRRGGICCHSVSVCCVCPVEPPDGAGTASVWGNGPSAPVLLPSPQWPEASALQHHLPGHHEAAPGSRHPALHQVLHQLLLLQIRPWGTFDGFKCGMCVSTSFRMHWGCSADVFDVHTHLFRLV